MALTADGYTTPELNTIITQMQATARSTMGIDIDVSSDSFLGHLIGVTALQIHQQYSDIAAGHASRDPDTAIGKSLDEISYWVGIIRKGEKYSTSILTITGIAGQVVPAGTQVASSTDGSVVFTLDADATIEVGGTVNAPITSTVIGEVNSLANTLTVITAVGVTSATNLSDVSVGSVVESDDLLRRRRARSVRLGGNGTVSAIEASLNQLNGVTTAVVVENDTWEPVSRGVGNSERPPKSFESVLEGGTDADIAKLLHYTKPIGISTYGDTVVEYVDSSSKTHLYQFTRAVALPISIKIEYSLYDEETFPGSGEDQIKDALVAFAATELDLGQEVIAQRFVGSCYQVPGISNVTVSVAYGTAAPLTYVTSQLDIQIFEKATLDKANIIVSKV